MQFDAFYGIGVFIARQMTHVSVCPKDQSRRCNFAPWSIAPTTSLDDVWRATGGVRHLQHPGTAWSSAPWGHCPLFHGAKLHRVDGPQ